VLNNDEIKIIINLFDLSFEKMYFIKKLFAKIPIKGLKIFIEKNMKKLFF
jgi:hypothetical protein